MMSRYQIKIVAETTMIFVLLMVAIWVSVVSPITCWLIGGGLVTAICLSWKWRGDTAADLGFCVRINEKVNDIYHLRTAFLWTLFALVAIVAIGTLVAPRFWKNYNPESYEWWRASFRVSLGYIIGVPLQELFLHGYFTNRMGQILPERKRLAAFLVGVMFGIVHIPNPVLAIGTLFFAGFGAYFFLAKSRNLYALSFSHLILSTTLKYLVAVPLLGHGSMRVGPGFWN